VLGKLKLRPVFKLIDVEGSEMMIEGRLPILLLIVGKPDTVMDGMLTVSPVSILGVDNDIDGDWRVSGLPILKLVLGSVGEPSEMVGSDSLGGDSVNEGVVRPGNVVGIVIDDEPSGKLRAGNAVGIVFVRIVRARDNE